MVAAIVKRDNIKNLGPLYDALADEYPETANAMVMMIMKRCTLTKHKSSEENDQCGMIMNKTRR